MWPAQFGRILVLGTRRKWPRPRRDVGIRLEFLPRRNCPYDLRDRTHDRELIQKETGLEKQFITRMLFTDSY